MFDPKRMANRSYLHRAYPVRYWLFIAYCVGVPNFLHFDATGRTHDQGLFNATSISEIVLVLAAAYLLAVILILNKEPLFSRKVNLSLGPWLALLIILTIASVFQPANRLGAPLVTDLPLSLFRLFSWVVAVILCVALYTRSPEERALDLIIQLIGRICWIWICIVWILLPIVPGQTFQLGQDGQNSTPQLGGQLFSPSILASLAIIGFIYSCFFFQNKLLRIACCGIAFATLVLARTRTEQASFVVIALLYALVLSRKPLLRLIAASCVGAVAVLAVVFRHNTMDFIARGQDASTLASFDGRTVLWQIAWEVARERLYIGYGFLAGPKRALIDHWRYSHWAPPHAHNEFLQALLSGGIIALVLVLWIYGRGLWLTSRTAKLDSRHAFLFLIFIQLSIKAMFGAIVVFEFGPLQSIFLLAYIGATGDRVLNRYSSNRNLACDCNPAACFDKGRLR